MKHWDRIKIAFVVTVIAVGIIMVFAMVIPLHIEDLVFSPVLVVPIFVVAYLFAPYIGKRIRYK